MNKSYNLIFYIILCSSCNINSQKPNNNNRLDSISSTQKELNGFLSENYSDFISKVNTIEIPSEYRNISKYKSYHLNKKNIEYLKEVGLNLSKYKNDCIYSAEGKFKFVGLPSIDFIILSVSPKNAGIFFDMYILSFDKNGQLVDNIFLGKEDSNFGFNYSIKADKVILQVNAQLKGEIITVNGNAEISGIITKKKFKVNDNGHFEIIEQVKPYDAIIKDDGKFLILDY